MSALMYLKIVLVALATQAFAQLKISQFSEHTCNFLQAWTSVSGSTPSIRFSIEGRQNDYNLSTNCVSRVESSFRSCKFSEVLKVKY